MQPTAHILVLGRARSVFECQRPSPDRRHLRWLDVQLVRRCEATGISIEQFKRRRHRAWVVLRVVDLHQSGLV